MNAIVSPDPGPNFGPGLHPGPPAVAYRDFYAQYAEMASFLWVMRTQAIDAPHYTAQEVAELEQRLGAQLDALMSAPALGWAACEEALALAQPGEVFAAAVTAFRSREVAHIQRVVELGLTDAEMRKALVSALGWLADALARPWIDRFLAGKDMRHKYLGVAACSVRRIDPGEALSQILARVDCRQSIELYARALRLVGELRRQDLMPAVLAAQAHDNPDVRFWAHWAALLLGHNTSATALGPYVLRRGPHRARAVQLAFRALPVDTARGWISTLAKNPADLRMVVQASGVLGDPHAVNWLIAKMADPALARVAGEAFTLITGLDLHEHQLAKEEHPADAAPNDDPADEVVAMDEDAQLPWPDPDKVAARWRAHGARFLVGRRYVLGKPPSPEALQHALTHATQRHRHAAALELALLGEGPLHNTRGRAAP